MKTRRLTPPIQRYITRAECHALIVHVINEVFAKVQTQPADAPTPPTTGRTDSEKILDACWNYLGTIDPEKVSLHLGQYCELAPSLRGIPIAPALADLTNGFAECGEGPESADEMHSPELPMYD